MPTSRRSFLKTGTLAALSAGLICKSIPLVSAQKQAQTTSAGSFQIPNQALADPLLSYNRSTFEPYVNSIFQAPDAQGRMVDMTLISVRSFNPPRGKFRVTATRVTDSFSLMFRAAGELPPFTSIHRVNHAALGTFDLFMTPRNVDGSMFYEAVFNRLN